MTDGWVLQMSIDSGVPETEQPEAHLVAASKSGDPQAFTELVRLHQRRVFRLSGRFFRRREDVEDVAQETFLAAWRRLDTYRARAPFEHWITRICLNCCYARLRKERPTERIEGELPGRGASADAALELERLLARLPARDRFVLLLLDGEGWSVAEIARRVGWTRANVKVRAHRARQRLRRELERGSKR